MATRKVATRWIRFILEQEAFEMCNPDGPMDAIAGLNKILWHLDQAGCIRKGAFDGPIYSQPSVSALTFDPYSHLDE